MENKINNPLLYITKENEKITLKDIEKSLQKVGIKKGDIIFIHSDITSFGKIGNIKNKEAFLEAIINSFKNIVGKRGTIIMPTFTYSFTKNEIYDINKTPSTVGVLTEYFRKMPNVKRSTDAIFSVSVFGQNKEYFTNTGLNCFGEDSIFEKLYNKNVKLIFFGDTFDMTYLHFIEQRFGVSYRFIKEFKGKSKINGELKEFIFKYNVRPLDKNITYDFDKISDYLKEKGVLNEVILGNSKIKVVKAVDTFNTLKERLEKDNFFLLKENPNLN